MTEREVREVLRRVVDPDAGVNIVDLGLVYGVEIKEDTLRVEMTVTNPVCPLGTVLQVEAETALREAFPGVPRVEVNLVFSPPWGPERMSPEARRRLGWGS